MADWSLLNTRTDNSMNALAAFQAGQEMGQQRKRQDIMAGYGKDPAGTQNALLGIGDIQTANQLQGYQQNQDRARRDQALFDQGQHDRTRREVVRHVVAVRHLPVEQRGPAFLERSGGLLQQLGVPVGAIQLAAADGLTDEEIDGLVQEFGGELERPQGVNLGNGGYGVFNPNRYDPETAFSVVREPAERAPPAGYAWGPDGDMVAIPGGPADPRTIEHNATVRRQATVRNPMPSRARGGGGASSIPSGFVLD